VYLAGPTAAGKSAVALALARRLDAEIVSADSMQVYRGMDIGTAKPAPAERAAVPHHLIDVVGISGSFDVARYVALARAAIADIQRRGRLPLVVGGSGLYLRALTEGLSDLPDSDPQLRAEIEAMGVDRVLEELRRVDPETAATIDTRNFRRVVRALEICRLTGRRSSALRRQWDAARTTPMHGLERDRDDLRARCDARVEAMFRAGLVDEVRALLPRGLAENRTARQAVGYREVIAHLAGGPSLGQTIELVRRHTRQLAKRQLTWFRHQTRVQWLRVARDEPPSITAERLARELKR
jgi:tRNA dimethylallyltransferase